MGKVPKTIPTFGYVLHQQWYGHNIVALTIRWSLNFTIQIFTYLIIVIINNNK